MRPLPKDEDWSAYFYLVYLVYFLVVPFLYPAPLWLRWTTAGATAVAVALYFLSYWVHGWRAFWVVGAFFALGTAFASVNPGSSVFFVYAAAAVGGAFEPPAGYRILAGLVALVGLESWALSFHPWLWVPAVFFSGFIGLMVLQQSQKRRLTRKLISAQSEAEHLAKVAERERIARDLHDLLGHTLSVIILKSELASRLTPTDPARAAEEIRDVERISRDALAQVRAAVRGYRSAGFESELREARQALEAAGIRVETTCDTPRLSPAYEAVFALALREGVTNVVRHSGARNCRLALAQTGEFCQLEIADDGRGGTLAGGNGLAGMRERVEALGGQLDCDGSHGTLLRIRVPA